jgi:hypothetical protein
MMGAMHDGVISVIPMLGADMQACLGCLWNCVMPRVRLAVAVTFRTQQRQLFSAGTVNPGRMDMRGKLYVGRSPS